MHTKPDLAWELIEEARAAGIPFRLVVADSVYGENLTLEARLFAAHIPYLMGLQPSHRTWQVVEDARHPPAFTPAEAAERLPKKAWQRSLRLDSHGKELVRYVAELELGTAYGPTRSVRLIAAWCWDVWSARPRSCRIRRWSSSSRYCSLPRHGSRPGAPFMPWEDAANFAWLS